MPEGVLSRVSIHIQRRKDLTMAIDADDFLSGEASAIEAQERKSEATEIFAADIDATGMRVPAARVKDFNKLIKKIVATVQKLVDIENILVASNQEYSRIAQTLNAMSDKLDRSYENLRRRTDVKSKDFNMYLDLEKVIENTRRGVKDINFKDRPLHRAEVRVLEKLRKQAKDMLKDLDPAAKMLLELRDDVKDGLSDLARLEAALNEANFRVKYVKSGEKDARTAYIDGNVFKLIRSSMVRTLGRKGEGAKVAQSLKGIAKEMKGTDKFFTTAEATFRGMIKSIGMQAQKVKSLKENLENALKAIDTATTPGQRVRKSLKNVLDLTTAVGVLGGTGIILVSGAGGPIAGAMLISALGARITKTVLKILKVV